MRCENCDAEVLITRSAFEPGIEYIVDMPEQLSKLHQSLLAKGLKPIFNCATYKIHRCNSKPETEEKIKKTKTPKTDNPLFGE